MSKNLKWAVVTCCLTLTGCGTPLPPQFYFSGSGDSGTKVSSSFGARVGMDAAHAHAIILKHRVFTKNFSLKCSGAPNFSECNGLDELVTYEKVGTVRTAYLTLGIRDHKIVWIEKSKFIDWPS
jgi:hypothetical protein